MHDLLTNPSYAGAFVFGRTRHDTAREDLVRAELLAFPLLLLLTADVTKSEQTTPVVSEAPIAHTGHPGGGSLMSRFFDDLERDLVRAAARPARRRFAAFGLTSVLVLGLAGSAAAGTYFALRSSSIAPFAASDVTPEQRVAPGTSVVAGVRSSDPDPGAPPWALRVSRSETGLQCSTVGQVRDGAFGIVGLDGVFREVPESNADACGEQATLVGTRIFAAKRSRDVRTVVNGVAGPDVEQVTVAVAGGEPRAVPHSPEGAFVFVLRRYPEDAQPVVTLRLRDGTTRRYDFGTGRFTVPDPYGGRAWKLQAMVTGTPQGETIPRLQPLCVTFVTARAVPDEPNVGSTPVCGLEAARPGVKHDALYFDTRRLSGDGPGQVVFEGDWNRHPPRVATWGIAREHRRVVVRAGRFRQQVSPRPNGAFVVFLPPRTDPKTVTVEVDGKRYGPSHAVVESRRSR